MSKKTRRAELKANLFETDWEELLYSTEESIKTKHIEVEKPIKEKKKIVTKSEKTPGSIFGEPISEKKVNCNCNKCGAKVAGTLVSFIYSPCSELMTPFINYTCPQCNHLGHRSVQSHALPVTEFNLVYF